MVIKPKHVSPARFYKSDGRSCHETKATKQTNTHTHVVMPSSPMIQQEAVALEPFVEAAVADFLKLKEKCEQNLKNTPPEGLLEEEKRGSVFLLFEDLGEQGNNTDIAEELCNKGFLVGSVQEGEPYLSSKFTNRSWPVEVYVQFRWNKPTKEQKKLGRMLHSDASIPYKFTDAWTYTYGIRPLEPLPPFLTRKRAAA